MIRIDNDNPKAIYEQLYDEIIRLIFSKSLKDEKTAIGERVGIHD